MKRLLKICYKIKLAILTIILSLLIPIQINAQNALILNGAYIIENGGTATNNIHIVIDQPDTLGIVRLSTSGHIHSESQYNFVTWNTGTNTGSYIFPFGVGGNIADSIPFTFNKTAGNNTVSISTWATDQQNNPKPEVTNVAAVTNMNGITDSVLYAIDRFWDIQAPSTTADLTFSYRGIENTTTSPTDLIQAQHWNGNSWDTPVGPGTNGVTNGIGIAGIFTEQSTFSPWVLIIPPCIDTVTIYPSICDGDNYIVGSSTYTVSGVYIDTLTNSFGCDSIITTNLTVNPISFNNTSASICQGDSILLGGDYQTTSGIYNDTIFNANSFGCDSIIITNLTVNPASFNNISASICQGDSILLGGVYQTTSGIYNDTIFGANIFGCDSIITTNLTVINSSTTTQTFIECEGFNITVGANNYNTTGLYTDIINNCDTLITDLTILPNPQLTLIKTDDNCDENTGSVIADVLLENIPISYIWSTGSQDSSINNLSEGLYSITVIDSNGCFVSDFVTLENIDSDCDYFVYLPNVFTPNGDGNNDIFYVRGKGIGTISLKIYNRWGNEVFESTSLSEGWDGSYKGEIQNTGVFVFILQVNFLNGETLTKSGDISIIR